MIEGIIFGCWDLFHVGHLRMLQSASRQCEFLHIGIFTDKVILGYKGKEPIIPLESRVEMLRGLKLNCPFKVFVQKFRGPINIKQAILFVSKRLLDKDLVMRGYHSKCGVIYIPYTDGISTGKIKNKIMYLSWTEK